MIAAVAAPFPALVPERLHGGEGLRGQPPGRIDEFPGDGERGRRVRIDPMAAPAEEGSLGRKLRAGLGPDVTLDLAVEAPPLDEDPVFDERVARVLEHGPAEGHRRFGPVVGFPGPADRGRQASRRAKPHGDKELLGQLQAGPDAVGAVAFPELAAVDQEAGRSVAELGPQRKAGDLDDPVPVRPDEVLVAGPMEIGFQGDEKDAVLVQFALRRGAEAARIDGGALVADEVGEEPGQDRAGGPGLPGHRQGHGGERLVADPLEVVLPDAAVHPA